MKKVWVLGYSSACNSPTKVIGRDHKMFDSYEEAETAAKRWVGDPSARGIEIVIYEAIAIVKAPIPAAEVIKL